MTYVVLLNWNGYRDTIECLESLLPVLSNSDGVIVCDNASSDGSAELISDWVAANFPAWGPMVLDRAAAESAVLPVPRRVHVIRNGANLGFAGGNNVGLRLALRDPECRYVWLLNNDTTVDSRSLPAALERMADDPNLGICGSTLVYFHDRDVVQALGGAVYSRLTGRSRHLGAFLPVSRVPEIPDEVEREMSYVVGAAMLVSRPFLEQIGLMQEDYFLYCEELDWAIRSTGRFRLGYAPQSLVWHKEGASIGTSANGGSPVSVFYLFRNRVRVCARYFWWYLPVVLSFCVLDVTKLLLRRRWPQARAAMLGVCQMAYSSPRSHGA